MAQPHSDGTAGKRPRSAERDASHGHREPSLLQGRGWSRSGAPQKQVCQPVLRHCGRTPSPCSGYTLCRATVVFSQDVELEFCRTCWNPGCQIMPSVWVPWRGREHPTPQTWASEPARCPAVASSESFGILGRFDSIPGSLADGTRGWQDVRAAGRAHPKSQGTYQCHLGGPARSTAPDRFKRCTVPQPSTNDLAKSEPGQCILKGCRRRVRHFSFLLGTDWFKSVSQ